MKRNRPQDEASLRALLESNEDDSLEFKGESLSRKEIGEYAVALGNEGGGLLVLGVTNRKPRRIVGVAPIPEVEAGRIRDAVLDSTGIRIDIDQIAASEGNVVVITIPSRPAGQVFFTKGGKYLMRSGEGLRGMTLAEIDRIRTSELKYRDALAEPVPGRWDECVDPIEVERLRTILRAKGREALAKLSPEELLRSLEVVQRSAGKSRMTRAGILLVGSAEALREYVPLHEVKIQRFDRSDLTPTLNEDLRVPIPVALQRATEIIEAVNTVESFQSGLFRVEIPKFAELAYREGVINALVHRDYEVPGTVAVRVYRDRLEVGNPGGWFGGVNERNILVTESRRRNELLAEALQRIGLVERSALGVKRMFEALLTAGKAPPEYRSTSSSVTLTLRDGSFDAAFAGLARRSHESGVDLDVFGLLVLSFLRRHREVAVEEAAELCQRDAAGARRVLDDLRNVSLLEWVQRSRPRKYVLGPRAYEWLNLTGERPRDLGMSEKTFEGLLLDELGRRGEDGLTNRQIREWSLYDRRQASRILAELVQRGVIAWSGKRGRGALYWHPRHRPTGQ